MLRDKSFGVNMVYTHNYGCAPGSHLSFNELLRAADDVGMLVALSQPHCQHYNWTAPDAEKTNGYARHAAFYVRMAGNHPAVVMYSMNHNALSYYGDTDPDLTDGRHNAEGKIGPRTDRNALQGLRAQAIVERLDSTRVVYHHSSGTLGHAHTNNLYLDFVPIQERSDWFEHWATEGVKPLIFCEYGVPWDINWTMFRGWYKGVRSWGSRRAPWEFCMGEWNSQFLGDRAFQFNDPEKTNLRWEAKQWQARRVWAKWNYPFNPSSPYSWGHKEQDEVWAKYITDNWRAFRTWGISARNAWGYSVFWELRGGVNGRRGPAHFSSGSTVAPRGLRQGRKKCLSPCGPGLQGRLEQLAEARTKSGLPHADEQSDRGHRLRAQRLDPYPGCRSCRCATTCRFWPTSLASRHTSPPRSTTISPGKRFRSRSS